MMFLCFGLNFCRPLFGRTYECMRTGIFATYAKKIARLIKPQMVVDSYFFIFKMLSNYSFQIKLCDMGLLLGTYKKASNRQKCEYKPSQIELSKYKPLLNPINVHSI